MDKQLELHAVDVRYGAFVAAQNVSLSLDRGDIGCLLGPSGCGKTTLLRAIAGFEQPSSGEIILGGRTLSSNGINVPPEQRRVGMVFQDFALFPHLNVRRNVAFGLKDLKREERRQRVQEMLRLVDLQAQAGRFPHELSGGQQQRVALARALAPKPDILLLDEPFSSLDSQLRESLASQVRQLLKANNVTAVLVTHDQQEAFAMADQLTLLREGQVVQAGSPRLLYQHPEDEFVARFLGPGAIITVAADNSPLQQLVCPGESRALRLLVRPEAVEYDPDSGVQAAIVSRTYRGARTLYELALTDGQRVPCLAPGELRWDTGATLPIRFNQDRLIVLPDRN